MRKNVDFLQSSIISWAHGSSCYITGGYKVIEDKFVYDLFFQRFQSPITLKFKHDWNLDVHEWIYKPKMKKLIYRLLYSVPKPGVGMEKFIVKKEDEIIYGN